MGFNLKRNTFSDEIQTLEERADILELTPQDLETVTGGHGKHCRRRRGCNIRINIRIYNRIGEDRHRYDDGPGGPGGPGGPPA